MKCNGPNSRGQRCEFIRWKPGPSASPQTAESPSLTPPFPVASQAYAPTGSFPIASQPVKESVFYPQRPPGIPHCKTSECGQSRTAPDCWRRLCRKHCIANGGAFTELNSRSCSSNMKRKVALAKLSLLKKFGTLSSTLKSKLEEHSCPTRIMLTVSG